MDAELAPALLAPRIVVASLSNVRASYGRSPVLQDVSLELWAGELLVLLGPNGAGKTSLVRVLTGRLRPSEGAVTVAGGKADCTSDRAVSLVPQEIGLYTWLTPRENCMAFARMMGVTGRQAGLAADRALRLAACEEVASTPVAQLSGGFKRRANIAAALVGEPRLLILDEPTVGVDQATRRSIARTLLSLKDEGVAILVVTHDFDDADVLADRAVFLFDGRVRSVGSPSELLAAAFAQRKRVEVTLDNAPDALQRRILLDFDAGPTARDEVWVLHCDVEHWDTRDLVGSLETAGLAVREVTIRRPGLGSLFTQLDAA